MIIEEKMAAKPTLAKIPSHPAFAGSVEDSFPFRHKWMSSPTVLERLLVSDHVFFVDCYV